MMRFMVGFRRARVFFVVATISLASQASARDTFVYPSSPRQGPREPAVPLRFEPTAEREVPGRPTGPPLPCGTGVWLVATDATLQAVDSDGGLRWERPDLAGALLPERCAAGREKGDGIRRTWLAIGGTPAVLALLSSADGGTERTITLPASPATPPVVAPPDASDRQSAAPEVWLVLDDRTLRAYDPMSGDSLWTSQLPGEPLGPPLPGDDPLRAVVAVDGELVGAGPGFATARRLALLPEAATPSTVHPDSTPHTDLFFAADDGRLRALRCRPRRRGVRCRERWSYRTGSRITSAPLVAGELVLASSFDNHVYAVSFDNGHLRWRRSTSHRLGLAAVPFGDQVLIAPETAGKVSAFRLEDGAPCGEYRAGDDAEVQTAPVVHGSEMAVLLKAGQTDSTLRLIRVDTTPPEGKRASPATPASP
jgi:outer membrane protein assembly factor BamB